MIEMLELIDASAIADPATHANADTCEGGVALIKPVDAARLSPAGLSDRSTSG
jgi:hypothetical protein